MVYEVSFELSLPIMGSYALVFCKRSTVLRSCKAKNVENSVFLLFGGVSAHLKDVLKCLSKQQHVAVWKNVPDQMKK